MFNQVYELQDSHTGRDGTGFDIDWHSEEIRVKYNHAHDNHGNGIATMACRNCEISGNRVEGNRGLFNCGKGQVALTNWHQDQSDDRLTSVENLKVVDNLILIDRDDTGALNSWKAAPGPAWKGNSFTGNRIVLKPGVTPAFVYDLPPDTAVDRIAENALYGFGDDRGHLGQESDLCLEIQPHSPIVVQNLLAVYDADSGQVTLSWDVDETTRPHVHHFNVHRSSTPHFGTRYTNMVGQAKGLAFTDEVDLDDRSVYYVVQAEDLVGDYGPAAEIGVKP
jgi:parallel beta-helix repeat protein